LEKRKRLSARKASFFFGRMFTIEEKKAKGKSKKAKVRK
jgi:hypothetical protein